MKAFFFTSAVQFINIYIYGDVKTMTSVLNMLERYKATISDMVKV